MTNGASNRRTTRSVDADDIAHRVQRMCEEGWLPAADDGVRIRFAPGGGRQCPICREPIGRNAVATILRTTQQQVERMWRLHSRCFLAWRRHCVKREASGQ